MILGTEWVVEAAGCDPAALQDLSRMRGLFDRLIADLDLHVLGEIKWHQFSGTHGISGLALLSESHLACHTFPESRAATFNLYCCRNRDAWPWEQVLTDVLGATTVNVRVLERVIQEGDYRKAFEYSQSKLSGLWRTS
jgi:S-adenosylmethionine decarboxylase